MINPSSQSHIRCGVVWELWEADGNDKIEEEEEESDSEEENEKKREGNYFLWLPYEMMEVVTNMVLADCAGSRAI